MQTFSIRDEIVEVVNKLFVYTDMQSWDKLQAEVFSPTVHFDMTSLGGERMDRTSADICAIWEKGFRDIDEVNHLAGNYLVQINDDSATVFAYATATHYRAAALNGQTREFVGTYNLALVRQEEGWRINAFRYNLKYLAGNIGLT